MSIKEEPGTVTEDLTEHEPNLNYEVKDIKNNSEENFQIKTECCLLEEDSSLPNATVSKAQWFESSNTNVKKEVSTLNLSNCEEGYCDQNSVQHKKETSAVPICLQSPNMYTTDTHCKTNNVSLEHQTEFQNRSSQMVLKSEPILSIDTDNNSFVSKDVQDFQKSLPTVADLIQKKEEQVKLYQCGTCPYSCNFLFNLYQHNLSHTMGNCYICDLCQSPYPYFLDLKYHLMSHADDDEISSQLLHGSKNISGRHIDEQPYSCDLCDYTCIDSSHLIRHNRESHTDVRPYSCDFCRFTCADSRYLKIHRKTHTVKKTYSCDFCSYTSVYSSALKQHIKNHTEEKPYSCDLCDFTCTRSFNLRRHQRTHTDDKPFCCDLCDFKSAYEPNLKEHKKHHTGEKPYSCDLCNFTSAYSFSLKLHKRTHTGEKPYSCDLCSYTCVSFSGLKRHKRKHTGERPYSCGLCNNTFVFASGLREHERSHKGTKPFSCDLCDFACTRPGYLKQHKIKRHAGQATLL